MVQGKERCVGLMIRWEPQGRETAWCCLSTSKKGDLKSKGTWVEKMLGFLWVAKLISNQSQKSDACDYTKAVGERNWGTEIRDQWGTHDSTNLREKSACTCVRPATAACFGVSVQWTPTPASAREKRHIIERAVMLLDTQSQPKSREERIMLSG